MMKRLLGRLGTLLLSHAEGTSQKRQPRARLRLERLEDRAVPASIEVANLNDTGAGSLRQAITDVNGGTDMMNTISFNSSLSGDVNLASQLPTITKNLTIITNSGQSISINGSGSSRSARGRTAPSTG
jgi:hypothetical protein